MTTERAIVKAILAYLNSLPGCLARKRWGGGMGVAGDPDIDACMRGRSVQLEVKRPGERPTPLQLKRLEEWRQAGAVAAVVHGVAEVRTVLEENQLLGRTLGDGAAYIVSE
ncbi:MAG: VRR-NUC domain-containing protein [Bryobacteraceae bacterium]